jgi:hypothetical protein
MIKCKTCGEVFPGLYVPEGSNNEFKTAATNADTLHLCSRGHKNEYVTEDYMDWSWTFLNKSTKVVLVSYPDTFRLDEGKSLIESSGTSIIDSYQIVKIFTQKYLNHSQYGLGSGKAE